MHPATAVGARPLGNTAVCESWFLLPGWRTQTRPISRVAANATGILFRQQGIRHRWLCHVAGDSAAAVRVKKNGGERNVRIFFIGKHTGRFGPPTFFFPHGTSLSSSFRLFRSLESANRIIACSRNGAHDWTRVFRFGEAKNLGPPKQSTTSAAAAPTRRAPPRRISPPELAAGCSTPPHLPRLQHHRLLPVETTEKMSQSLMILAKYALFIISKRRSVLGFTWFRLKVNVAPAELKSISIWNGSQAVFCPGMKRTLAKKS